MKTINSQKKAQIEQIENSISQIAGQLGVAFMTICETNLTDDDKRRHQNLTKQINNYKQQQTASGMSTSSNNQKINRILEQLNDDKMQILSIQIGNKNTTVISCHFSQNESIQQKQIDKINIITDQIEKMQDNLGTIILGDFNINLKDKKLWNNLNKKFSYKFTKRINQNTRENRQIDNILTSKKLDKIINNSKSAVGVNNNISDHQPILMQINIMVDQKEICEQIVNQDEQLQESNKKIKNMCLIKQQNEKIFIQKISKIIKQIINRKRKLQEKRFKTNKKLIKEMNKYRYNNIKQICFYLYQKLDKYQQQEHFNNHLKMIIENLQTELYQDRVKNPKKYFQRLKKILGLGRNNEILEPGGTTYNKQQFITTNKQEQMDIVKEYFDKKNVQRAIPFFSQLQKRLGIKTDRIVLSFIDRLIDRKLLPLNLKITSDTVEECQDHSLKPVPDIKREFWTVKICTDLGFGYYIINPLQLREASFIILKEQPNLIEMMNLHEDDPRKFKSLKNLRLPVSKRPFNQCYHLILGGFFNMKI